MISSSRKFIFVHIPKTGGNSIQDALRQFADDRFVAKNPNQDGVERFGLSNPNFPELQKHSRLSDYQRALQGEFEEYKIYATMRNPFDKLVSFFFSPHRGPVVWSLEAFERFVVDIPPIEYYLLADSRRALSRLRDLERINFLRFENLPADFERMCNDLSLSGSALPHRNKSLRRRDYKEYFSDELRLFVREKHALEMELGGYHY